MNASDVSSAAPEIALALACLKTGIVLEMFEGDRGDVYAEGLAAAAPELFDSAGITDWGAIFGRLGGGVSHGFHDVILVSDGRVHVLHRLESRPDTALVAVSSGTVNVGLVLASLRSKLLEIEAR